MLAVIDGRKEECCGGNVRRSVINRVKFNIRSKWDTSERDTH